MRLSHRVRGEMLRPEEEGLREVLEAGRLRRQGLDRGPLQVPLAPGVRMREGAPPEEGLQRLRGARVQADPQEQAPAARVRGLRRRREELQEDCGAEVPWGPWPNRVLTGKIKMSMVALITGWL